MNRNGWKPGDEMLVVHTDDPAYNDNDEDCAIFLAGPTPRSQDVESWRPGAIRLLNHWGFDGMVLVPERRDRQVKIDYLDQVEWEYRGLQGAKAILFWVPRDMEKMPALTTNVEFGCYVGKHPNVFYGRPEGAPHTRYLDWLYNKVQGPLMLGGLKIGDENPQPDFIGKSLAGTIELCLRIGFGYTCP